EKFYFGFTLPQLLQNKVDLYESTTTDLSRLEDHYMVMGGYTIAVNDDIKVIPSFLLKYVSPTPIKIDATARVMYKDMVWLGGSWRNNDAFVAMVGYEWNELVSLGYAYDFTTSDIKNYSDGTHEIVLGLRFNQE
ncbi:MAG: type IX secretion system membrane protein PorP/SprF, partial [Flavobacteriales bacterium]|nr:type IX secretion system membrane protein PorP/SprF [Flavobacteriales bacterium]